MSGKKAAAVTTGISTIRMIIPAGKAAPTPPVGPALGQKGVKAIDFCKLFNDQTKHYTQGVPLTAVVTVNPDRTFSFITKSPPASWLLKQAAQVDKGTSRPRNVSVGSISLKHVYEIAKIKQNDPGHVGLPLEKVCTRIIGTAQGMGIDILP